MLQHGLISETHAQSPTRLLTGFSRLLNITNLMLLTIFISSRSSFHVIKNIGIRIRCTRFGGAEWKRPAVTASLCIVQDYAVAANGNTEWIISVGMSG